MTPAKAKALAHARTVQARTLAAHSGDYGKAQAKRAKRATRSSSTPEVVAGLLQGAAFKTLALNPRLQQARIQAAGLTVGELKRVARVLVWLEEVLDNQLPEKVQKLNPQVAYMLALMRAEIRKIGL